MLKFVDDTQISVFGLDEILAELYAESRQANEEIFEEIIHRLEAAKNFIPSSDRAREEYSYTLLREYRTYVKGETFIVAEAIIVDIKGVNAVRDLDGVTSMVLLKLQ